MDIRLTFHARARRMPVYGLTREDVITIIETAREPFEQGAEAIVYTAYLGGVEYGVVVKRDTDPPLVITVYEVYYERGA